MKKFQMNFYSSQHLRRFETEHSIVKIDKDDLNLSKLRLLVDNLEIKDWFNQKYREFQKDLGINQKHKQGEDRGFKL